MFSLNALRNQGSRPIPLGESRQESHRVSRRRTGYWYKWSISRRC